MRKTDVGNLPTHLQLQFCTKDDLNKGYGHGLSEEIYGKDTEMI